MTTSAPSAARLSESDLLDLYRTMVLIRKFELAVQRLYKQGEIPGFIHLYVGQEATAAGVCAHLRDDDWITSTHRGHGHALAKGVSPRAVMAELCGRADGCRGGRGGSMHLFDPTVGMMGTNGLVGGGTPFAVGAALGAKMRGTDQVGVTFFGDGAVNHGAFHESINFAAIQDAPVVFVCENNLYATATPLESVTRQTQLSQRAAAYDVPGVSVDGNDVVEVWRQVQQAVTRARAGAGPTLIEARTYRTVGHHEGQPPIGGYRTAEEVEQWKKRCPIQRLREQGGIPGEKLDAIDEQVDRQIDEAVEAALAAPAPDPQTRFHHMLAPPVSYRDESGASAEPVEQGWLEAVRDGVAEEMRRDANVIYLGEGIGERGGAFAHTKGLYDEFGARRVIDTPISELAFTGASVGAAATGCPAVADLMFVEFLFDAASQIVLQASKLRYMSAGRIGVPIVIRAAMGMIRNAGPHHSGAYYPMWAHVPGLIVVVPSCASDAKGLMKSALRTPDPVIFLEHKMLFATHDAVPGGEHVVPLGRARIVRAGSDLTLVACGIMVHRCLEAADRLSERDVACEVIDLRTIAPLDAGTIATSVARTGHLLIADEAWPTCGLGAEITAAMMPRVFDDLDAPIGRLHTEPVAHPFCPTLEAQVQVTTDRIVEAALGVMAGTAPRSTTVEYGDDAIDPVVPTASPAVMTVTPGDGSVEPPDDLEGVAVRMPHQDLTVTEATVVRWLKQVGDEVEEGEEILEVETDKAAAPIEAPVSGVLTRIVTEVGDVVRMGEVLGYVRPSEDRPDG